MVGARAAVIVVPALAAIYPYVFVVMAFVGGSLAETLGPRLAILDAKWAARSRRRPHLF